MSLLHCAQCGAFVAEPEDDLDVTGENVWRLLRAGETPFLDCVRCEQPTGVRLATGFLLMGD